MELILVLDTGASHSVISMDLVDDIGIYGDIDDMDTNTGQCWECGV